MQELLEAGVHFGHQTKRWNPKMKPYIFGQRNGIYVIDLGKTARLFQQAEEFVSQLAAAGQAPLPRIVLVSVDPERDTPELLAEYLAYFGDDNLGITGSLEEIRKLTSALGIYFDKRPTADDNYSVDHSAAVLIIDPDGNFYGLVSGPHQVANYVNDLPPILGSR